MQAYPERFLGQDLTMTAFSEQRTGKMMAIALAFAPLLALIAPRAMAGYPLLIGLAAFISLAFLHKSLPSINRPALIAACGILTLSLCSTLWAFSPEEALDRTIQTFPILLGLVLLISAAGNLDARAMASGIRLMPYILAFTGLIMAMEYWLNYPVYRMLNNVDVTKKVNPSLLNRGQIIMALTAFSAFATAWILEKGWRRHILLASCIGTLAASAAFSSSQSAQMGLLAGALCMIIFPAEKNWAWRILILLIVGFLIALPWISYAAFVWADDINASKYFGNGGAYGAQRLEIWHFIAGKIFQHPLLGYGTEAARMMTFTTDKLYFDSNTVLHPHDFGLQVWLEFGALGIVLASLMLGWICEAIHKTPLPVRRFILSAFIVTLAVASTSYGMWQGWWLGLLILVAAYSVILTRISKSLAPQNEA